MARSLIAAALLALCLVAWPHPALFNEIAQYVIVRLTGERVLVTYETFINDQGSYAASAAEEAEADRRSGYALGVHEISPPQRLIYLREDAESLGRGIALIVDGATVPLVPLDRGKEEEEFPHRREFRYQAELPEGRAWDVRLVDRNYDGQPGPVNLVVIASGSMEVSETGRGFGVRRIGGEGRELAFHAWSSAPLPELAPAVVVTSAAPASPSRKSPGGSMWGWVLVLLPGFLLVFAVILRPACRRGPLVWTAGIVWFIVVMTWWAIWSGVIVVYV